MANINSFDVLIERFISERLAPGEIPVFFRFLEEEEFRQRYADRIDMDFLEESWLGWSNDGQKERLYNTILQAGRIQVREEDRYNSTERFGDADMSRNNYGGDGLRRISHIKRGWRVGYAAAAAVVLLVGVAVHQYAAKKEIPQVAQAAPPSEPVVQDLLPGQNKAVLILGDHTVVALDSLARGSTVWQGGMKIVKEDNGKINYLPDQGLVTGETAPRNTVRTPRGGQYRLTLSDGTQVWLNAASSITYPARFSDGDRTVSISGEVYFEVAKNAGNRFVVNVDNSDDKVEVLGTHFNINAYEDETAVRTTLLEGKVKVSGINSSVILKPGQQAAGTRVSDDVDITKIMSWKNGVFSLEGKSIQQVLRELARWYDLTLVYEKEVPAVKLRGEIGMNLNLSQVLKGLAAMDVNCRLEPGRKLLIFP